MIGRQRWFFGREHRVAECEPIGGERTSSVQAQEQIPDGLPSAQRQPAAFLVLGPVVNEMAALTERLEVPWPILGWIMVEVGTGEHDSRLVPGQGGGQLRGSRQPPQRPAPAGAPDLIVLVPPPPIAEMIDKRPWGRPQLSQRPWARRKRMTAESWGQSIG